MQVRRLRHFVAVADTLNFREAAERLHLTQPSITRSIAALERDLGVRLFDRDTTQVRLTPEGTRLLAGARDVVERVDALEATAKAMRNPRSEELRIGLYPSALAEMTNPVLVEFQRRYPQIELRVRYIDPSHGLQPLFRREIDAAAIPAPTAGPGLRVVPVFHEPVDALLPADHPLASSERVSVDDLLDEPWTFIPGAIPNEWVAVWLALDRRGGTFPAIGTYAVSEDDCFAAVAYQKCVALVPRSGIRMHAQPGVVGKPTDAGTVPEAVVTLASSTNAHAAAFADLAVELAPQLLHLVPGAELP